MYDLQRHCHVATEAVDRFESLARLWARSAVLRVKHQNGCFGRCLGLPQVLHLADLDADDLLLYRTPGAFADDLFSGVTAGLGHAVPATGLAPDCSGVVFLDAKHWFKVRNLRAQTSGGRPWLGGGEADARKKRLLGVSPALPSAVLSDLSDHHHEGTSHRALGARKSWKLLAFVLAPFGLV